jgi:hypothetical protein
MQASTFFLAGLLRKKLQCKISDDDAMLVVVKHSVMLMILC